MQIRYLRVTTRCLRMTQPQTATELGGGMYGLDSDPIIGGATAVKISDFDSNPSAAQYYTECAWAFRKEGCFPRASGLRRADEA